MAKRANREQAAGPVLSGSPSRAYAGSRWAGPLPVLLVVVFVLAAGGLLAWLHFRRRRADRLDLQVHARGARQAVAQCLDRHARHFGFLAEHAATGRMSDTAVRKQASAYVTDHPELRRVRWVDPNERVRWAVPAEPYARMAGLSIRHPEARRAFARAAREKRAAYTGPFAPQHERPLFEVYVPVCRGEKLLGMLNATYPCAEVLREMVPPDLPGAYRVCLFQRNGRPLAQLSPGDDRSPVMEQALPLDPPGHGLALRLCRCEGGFWSWPTVLLAALSAIFAGAMACATCCLRRNLRRREQAGERAEDSLRQKEMLLKEIHHRVKNNLQLVTSLLTLQGEAVEDPEVRRVLEECRGRIRTMALIHRELHSTEDPTSVRMADYVENIANHLSLAYARPTETVDVKVAVEDVSLDPEEAIPCGLILNELVSNALKYAFVETGRGKVGVELRSEGDGLLALIVRDNGAGLPAEVHLHAPGSLGLRLVRMLTEQLQGTLEVDRDHGTCFKVTFRPRAGAGA
jgi:two-component sensor histidine kinase